MRRERKRFAMITRAVCVYKLLGVCVAHLPDPIRYYRKCAKMCPSISFFFSSHLHICLETRVNHASDVRPKKKVERKKKRSILILYTPHTKKYIIYLDIVCWYYILSYRSIICTHIVMWCHKFFILYIEKKTFFSSLFITIVYYYIHFFLNKGWLNSYILDLKLSQEHNEYIVYSRYMQ